MEGRKGGDLGSLSPEALYNFFSAVLFCTIFCAQADADHSKHHTVTNFWKLLPPLKLAAFKSLLEERGVIELSNFFFARSLNK